MKRFFPFFLPVLLLLALPASASEAPPPGTWTLSTDGELISIWANEVPFQELMKVIQDVSPAKIGVDKLPDRNVSVRYSNLTLDELLSKLDISYVLTYAREGEDPAYKLEKGWVGHFDEQVSAPSVSFSPSAATPGLNAGAPGALSNWLSQISSNQLAQEAGEMQRAPFPVTMNLDGDLSEWPAELPWQQVKHDMGTGSSTNDADSSFAVATVADQTNIYLAIKVADDSKVLIAEEAMDSENEDSLELFLGKQATAQSPDDASKMVVRRHQVWRVGEDGKPTGSGRQYIALAGGTRAIIVDGADGWFIEAAIPLASLGAKPDEPMDIGFNIRLNDDDDGGERDQTLIWSRNERLPGGAIPTRSTPSGTLHFMPFKN